MFSVRFNAFSSNALLMANQICRSFSCNICRKLLCQCDNFILIHQKIFCYEADKGIIIDFFYRRSIFVSKDVKSYLTSISFIKPSYLLLDVLFYAEIRHAYHKVEEGNHAGHFYLAILFCKRSNLDELCSSNLASLFHLV